MNKEEFIEKLSINGKLVNKRCTESYITNNHLLDSLNDLVDQSFGSISERIKYLKYGGGYCKVCGIRTNLDVNGQGFAKYCKEHFHEPKKNKPAHNRKEIDKEYLVELYVNQQKSLLEISKLIGISNVTLKKRLIDFNIHQRNHSESISLSSANKGIYSFNYDKSWWENEYKTKSAETIANELGCSSSLVLQRLEQHEINRTNFFKESSEENVIFNFLNELNITYIKKDRSVLNGKELDIYIPSHNIAIEINGIFWHTEAKGKLFDYHLNKTMLCAEKNIQLLHFWDIEIKNKIDIIFSMLRVKLGIATRIYARKCFIKEVDKNVAKEFFNENHIQGNAGCNKIIGLYYNDELVSAASFITPRFNKKYDWELVRFATIKNVVVVGGMSKLLSTITGSIISYANRRWSMGNVYKQCNFTLIDISRPNYFYTKNFKTLENRIKYQKHKLINNINYDKNKSEKEIMELSGYNRIWDCGNLVYVTEQ